jgi:hypothetical protein
MARSYRDLAYRDLDRITQLKRGYAAAILQEQARKLRSCIRLRLDEVRISPQIAPGCGMIATS